MSRSGSGLRIRWLGFICGRNSMTWRKNIWIIFLFKIRKGNENRRRFMRKPAVSQKRIKHMKNFCFRISKESVWNCMECICLRFWKKTVKERICLQISKRNWQNALKWENIMRFQAALILLFWRKMQTR